MYIETDSLYAENIIGFDEVAPIEFGPCGFDLPIFPGSLDSLTKFILARFDYSLYNESLSGVVYISFVIDSLGAITDVKVVQGINSEINTACAKIIESLPQWLPAKDSKGNKITVSLVMPFRFEGKKG